MGALIEIAVYLLQTVLSLFLLAVMLRFLLQVFRADFYNPISQFLVKVTNPVLAPMRRVIPPIGSIDTATVVLLIAVQMLGIVGLLLLYGSSPPNILWLLLWSLIGIAGLLVNFYFFALLAIIILSWVAPGSSHPAISLLYQLTEPVMRPFRKLLPPMGGLDLSPIFMFVAINILKIILSNVAASVGLHSALVFGL
jgi:YggT family protein